MMYPFYIFMAALTIFLIYNYRQVIKEKLGYVNFDEQTLTKSVQDLQYELRGTADAMIEQFEQEHQRMELNLLKAQEQIAHLKLLLLQAETVQNNIIHRSPEFEDKTNAVVKQVKRPEDQKVRIVLDLAEHGMDIHEISKATGIAYSEVRLLINIGRRH